MNSETLTRLLSAEGSAALRAAAELSPTVTTYPACVDRLAKRFPTDVARAALDTVLLRAKAVGKFSRAEFMFFDREALEMASGEIVARYRAERFAPFRSVLDLCCGIGGDAVGLATVCRDVITVDRDPVRLRMAGANVAAYGDSCRALEGDVVTSPLPVVDAAFADPGRRPGGRRVLSLGDYEPPVSAILARFPAGFPIGVKVAPGVAWSDITPLDAEAEFISVGGELKECVLWFGPLKTCRRRATVLPGTQTLEADEIVAAPEVGQPGDYLYDPDPAATRSGLVALLAQHVDGRLVDSDIAFVASDKLCPTPFATAYRIEQVLPFHTKRVGEWLRSHQIGRITFLKRGSPIDVDELRTKWKLRGESHRAVILTRVAGKPTVFVGERVG